ncbi:MAG: RNA 2',3'-cyclic phosphodiesterase [Bryobacterales bacterium]|nr:RNA 2',3'-cyclic phosphodiesterase [Bryobacterales bacterium]
MRLFTAIDPPEAVVNAMSQLVADLKPLARLAWSPRRNWHITTRFIGEWPESRLDELRRALDNITRREPFPTSVRGLGFFPNGRAPRVFWAGIEAGPELAGLARDTDAAVVRLGGAADDKPYSPHLTLGRNRDGVSLSRLQQRVATLGECDLGTFTASSFHLYLSETAPGGSIYTQLAEFPFHP